MAEITPSTTPKYRTPSVNASIQLFYGHMILHHEINGQEEPIMSGEGTLAIEWFPHPYIKFHLTYSSASPVHDGLPITGRLWKGVTEESIDPTPELYTGEMSGSLTKSMIIAEAESLSYITFHLPNFYSYSGDTIGSGKATRQGRTILHNSEWHLTLDSVEGQEELITSLEESSGYAITHAASLRKTDNQPFLQSESTELLRALQGLFSFARGFKTSPILPVGFNRENSEIWQKWEQPRVDAWHFVDSWFSKKHPQTLNDIFPAFLDNWSHSLWGDTLRLSLYWYLESNRRRGIEGAIILAQAGLELLSWVMLVQDKALLSKGKFKKASAADNLRTLLSACNIPLDIPSYLINLNQLALSENWTDGPQAWIEMRNSIVHPDNKDRERFLKASPSLLEEVWHLGMWYTEMVLLRQLDYHGVYVNRMRKDILTGRMENVPWALP